MERDIGGTVPNTAILREKLANTKLHYGTAPVDLCRLQNRESHDYLRAHKGSRRMSRPLIQDSSVSVLFLRYKGNLT